MQKHKIWAAVLALAASICLWFYAVTVVNPDDSITVNGITVEFEGEQALAAQGLMLTGGENIKVSAKFSGRRSDLKELNSETVKAVADLTRITTVGEHPLSWTLVYPETVASGDISEVSRSPSRITVKVSEIKQNNDIPIEVIYTGDMDPDLMIDEDNVTIGVETLSVIGPADEVGDIHHAIVQIDVTDKTSVIDGEFTYVFFDKQGNELKLSKYAVPNTETIRVTVPILHYKDLNLRVDLTPGGGATSQDAVVELKPSTIRVSGSPEELAKLPEEYSIKTIDLGTMGYSQTLVIKPTLPTGITNQAEQENIEVKLELVGLTTKTITIPTANIHWRNTTEEISFAVQSVDIQLRGKAAALSRFTSADINLVADFAAGYDEKTKKITLQIEFVNPSISVGAIGGPYSLPVILESERES